MPPTDLVRREARLGLMHRVRSSQTYDAEARTVEIVAATDTPVRMPGWRLGLDTDYLEILDMSPSAVDLSSIEARNCPLLDSHNRWSLQSRLGAVTAAQLSGSQLIVVGSFGESEAARQAEAEMNSAAPPPVSSGYRVEQMQFERFEGPRHPLEADRGLIRPHRRRSERRGSVGFRFAPLHHHGEPRYAAGTNPCRRDPGGPTSPRRNRR